MGFLNHVKTAWNGEVRCDWCGRLYKEIDGEGLFGAPGALIGRAVATAKHNYCSKACKLAAKEDYERRKANGQLTATEQMKESVKEQTKEMFAEPLNEVKEQTKDALSEPLNEMKNQIKDSFGAAFGGMGGMFRKKK